MGLKQFVISTFVGAFVLLSGTSAFAKPDDDDFDDDAFDEDNSYEEDESSEEEVDSSPLDMEDTEDIDPAGEDSGEGLLLTQGTMQAGGMLALSVDIGMRDAPDTPGLYGDGAGGYFTFAPQLGYFVIDNLELLAEFGFEVPFGSAWDNSFLGAFNSIPFNIGARYIFDFNIICVYAGAFFGMEFIIPEQGDTLTSIVITATGGILFPFGRHIALDAGMRFITNIGIGDNGGNTLIQIPFGYFGIAGFFNLFD
ncbi:MAG: hypothetical protein GY847_04670 [Proteobacteria bacterium]|nr:hypothetical protein [Pseudomonadota bacterium]